MIESILAEKYGITAHYFESTDSTNSQAKRHAIEGAAEWECFIAKSQSGGRGRLGKSFHSPEGGLYLSVLLRPTLSSGDNLLITTAAAVAVREAISSVLGVDTKIKWVNDIIKDGKKVCGILAESAIIGSATAYTVLGIGINLFGSEEDIPDELKNIMGFVAKREVDAEEKALLIAEILKNFKKYYVNLSDKPHLEKYRENMICNGAVFVSHGDTSYPAEIKALDDDFRLIVERDGELIALSFGEVSTRL